MYVWSKIQNTIEQEWGWWGLFSKYAWCRVAVGRLLLNSRKWKRAPFIQEQGGTPQNHPLHRVQQRKMLDEAEISSVEARGWARREWRLSAPPYNLPLPVYSPPLSRGSARDKEAKSVATFSFHGRLRFTMCTPPSQVAGLHIFRSAHVVFCTYFVLHIFCSAHILSWSYFVLHIFSSGLHTFANDLHQCCTLAPNSTAWLATCGYIKLYLLW